MNSTSNIEAMANDDNRKVRASLEDKIARIKDRMVTLNKQCDRDSNLGYFHDAAKSWDQIQILLWVVDVLEKA